MWWCKDVRYKVAIFGKIMEPRVDSTVKTVGSKIKVRTRLALHWSILSLCKPLPSISARLFTGTWNSVNGKILKIFSVQPDGSLKNL